MIQFRQAPRPLNSPIEIVEVWDDARLLATIAPSPTGIQIVSEWFAGEPRLVFRVPPAIEIDFLEH
jgi:hypothetical protein